MIHLQRAKLGVACERAKEDFGDLRDVGGEPVVTLARGSVEERLRIVHEISVYDDGGSQDKRQLC